jgi:hypothetical protein
MPELTDLTNEVATLAKGAAYVVVGLGVLGFQRAQVERRQLQDKLSTELPADRLAELRSALVSGIQRLDGLVDGASQLVETTLEPLEEQLPAAARDAARRARRQVRDVHQQVRGRIVPAA